MGLRVHRANVGEATSRGFLEEGHLEDGAVSWAEEKEWALRQHVQSP